MIRTILFAMLLGGAVPAAACECAHEVLDTQAIRAAKDVFVFRVMSAAVVPSDAHPNRVLAKIKVIDRLRGAPDVRTVMYSTPWCCGIRIEVGGEYMAFATAAGSRLEIHQGNLLAIGALGYSRDAKIRRDVISILAGKRNLDEHLVDESGARLSQFPPPPPPPCP